MLKPKKLPLLRPDLKLVIGPKTALDELNLQLHFDGSQKYIQTNWIWFELLRCWNGVSPTELLEEVRLRGWVKPHESDLISLVHFLADNQLLIPGQDCLGEWL